MTQTDNDGPIAYQAGFNTALEYFKSQAAYLNVLHAEEERVQWCVGFMTAATAAVEVKIGSEYLAVILRLVSYLPLRHLSGEQQRVFDIIVNAVEADLSCTAPVNNDAQSQRS